MPRARDIGWQHGKMIGGNSHHVQCNYCHRTMIGGITRFKKHLASKKGEIRGCEAVPKEVREIIKKHLAAWRKRKTSGKKKKMVNEEPSTESSSEDKDTEGNESDHEIEVARLEGLPTFQEVELSSQQMTNDQQLPMGSREHFDALPIVQCTNEQGLTRRRATDLGWDHGLMVNGDRQKIECKYCHKVILGGGISRLKQHLAGERGNIIPCENVPEDVKIQMQQHLGFKVMQRQKKHKESEKVRSPMMSSIQNTEGNDDDDQRSPKVLSGQITNGRRRRRESGEASPGRKRRQRKQSIPFVTPVNVRPGVSQEILDQADMAVAKFMYDVGIPFSAANSSYFQPMADAIAAVGPGYTMPSCQSIRGNLLNRCVQEASELCVDLKKSWEGGCSVMADRWIDGAGRTVVNFYVYCSKGSSFLKSFDVSQVAKSSEDLFNLFDSIVQDVGPRNIVHFVTDTTPNFKAAGKLLAGKYKTFYWSASATHCIDMMLEELGKMNDVDEILSKAKRVCRFINNHDWLFNILRNRTGGRDIVRPGTSRSMTNMLTVQNFVSLKDHLHQMFTSTAWMQSDLSKQRIGLEVTDIVLDPQFWSSCGQILKVIDPLLTALQVADSNDRPSLGYIYDALDMAKKGIVSAFNNKELEYFPYLKVIDHIWGEELHNPLHAAAYFLNPSLFYSPNFSTNKLIQKGLLDSIEIIEQNITAQDMITKQITSYEDAAGDFSRPVAVRGRESLPPAIWWSLYAADYPELQRFAMRILNQTCSAIQCDRTWSLFEHAHADKTNRLESLAFVHYNLRLQERQSAVSKPLTKDVQDPTYLEGMDTGVSDWIEDSCTLDGEDITWMVEGGRGDSVCLENNMAMKAENSGYSPNEGSSDGSNNSDENEDL